MLTEKQRKFLEAVEMYCGIADNGNIMMEAGWLRPTVAAVGRSLGRKGAVEYTPVNAVGFEGGIWQITEEGRRLLNGHQTGSA